MTGMKRYLYIVAISLLLAGCTDDSPNGNDDSDSDSETGTGSESDSEAEPSEGFVTVWKTNTENDSDYDQIKLPLVSDGEYDFVVHVFLLDRPWFKCNIPASPDEN